MKKNVKRLLITLSVAALGALTVAGLAACGGSGVDMHEHQYVAGTSTATCLEDGVLTYTCKFCAFSYEEAAHALGHNMVTVEAYQAKNCQEVSYNEHKACTRCDHTEGYVEGEAGPHVTEAVPAHTGVNCQDMGYKAYTRCTLCDYTDGYEETEVGPHDMKTIPGHQPVDCLDDGYEDYQECNLCGEIEGYVEIPGGHAWEDVSRKESTCLEPGYTAHQRCTRCGEKNGDYQVIEAKGHDMIDVAADTPADCSETGYSAHRKCNREGCDYTEGRTEITGPHKVDANVWEYNGTQHWHPTVCEHYVEPTKANHTSGTCTDCHYDPNESTANFTFKASGNNYVVTGLSEAGKSAQDLVIPVKYSNKEVVGIADFAFQGETNIKTIVLPASITKLGIQVFMGCTALQSVVIPSTVETIPENTFMNCTALSSVTLRGGLKKIDAQAFAGTTALASITLPTTLTYIGSYAFRSSGLTEVTVPASVTAMHSFVFAECASLTKATVLANISYYMGGWFDRCEKLAELTLPFIGSSLNVNGDTATTAFGYVFGITKPAEGKLSAYVAVEISSTSSYYIPASLKKVTVLGGTIATGSFNGCTMLENVYYASGVTVQSNTGRDDILSQLQA